MSGARRRRPGIRLLLILAALASIIAGYYLGQYWQRRPLAELSARIYPAGRPVKFHAGVDPDAQRAATTPVPWRLFLSADTRDAQCVGLIRHYATVINRLAAWPDIQARLRLTLLAYDQPDATDVDAFTGGAEWIEVITADPESLDQLSSQLGLIPKADAWCTGNTANAILVSPKHRQWALIPHEQAAMMAHNIRTIIAFVE